MRSSNRGMTLIEVLVAFVVLSITMAVILQIFSGGMRNARLANSYSSAVFLAQSKLAETGVVKPLAVAEDMGRVGSDLHWRVTVVPADEAETAAQQVMAVKLYKVRVRINWNEGGRERQVELTSLRLGSR